MYAYDVACCPRCLKPHKGLKFLPLKIASEDYNHFAMCPETKQPVIAQMVVNISSPIVPPPESEAPLKEEAEIPGMRVST